MDANGNVNFDETSFQTEYANYDVDKSNKTGQKEKSERSKLKTAVLDKQYLVNDGVDTASTAGLIDTHQAKLWRSSAVIISWFSIVATLAIGITEFVVSEEDDSSAAFGLAFSSTLDVMTSAVVLWRYYKANDTFSQKREHISCIILGVLFIVSSIGIAGKAIFGLLNGESPILSRNGPSLLVITSIVAACTNFFLFIIKVIIAKQLSSWTLLTDALNSLMGGIVALSMIITTEITKTNPFLWYLDSTVGLIVSLFLLCYGLWLMTKHIPEIRRVKLCFNP